LNTLTLKRQPRAAITLMIETNQHLLNFFLNTLSSKAKTFQPHILVGHNTVLANHCSWREMPRSAISHLVAPSPNLLRFLRSQVGLSTTIPCPVSRCARLLQQSRTFSTCPKQDTKLLPAPRSWSASEFAASQACPLREAQSRPLDLHATRTTSVFGENNAVIRRRRSSHGDGKRPLLRRLFSSHQQSSWWWRWWKGVSTPRGRQLPPLSSFLDASSIARSTKAANEPRLRCTEFNENGNVTLVNGEFKKSELIAKVSKRTIF
jgi:magnesium transporter